MDREPSRYASSPCQRSHKALVACSLEAVLAIHAQSTVCPCRQLILARNAQCNLAFNVTLLYQFVGVSSTNAKAAKSASSSKGRSKKVD